MVKQHKAENHDLCKKAERVVEALITRKIGEEKLLATTKARTETKQHLGLVQLSCNGYYFLPSWGHQLPTADL